jgi:hypothetical protein
LVIAFKVAPVVLAKTPADRHEKDMDIGSGHNTQLRGHQ